MIVGPTDILVPDQQTVAFGSDDLGQDSMTGQDLQNALQLLLLYEGRSDIIDLPLPLMLLSL